MVDVLKQVNWVDICVLIVFFRICYISFKNGFPAEIFKFFGTISAVYLAYHYYISLSDFIQERVGLKPIPVEFLDFISFILLILLGYFAAVVLRETFSRFIKMEAVPSLSKWGGITFGVARGAIVTSIVIYTLAISSVTYFKDSATGSFLGKNIFNIAPSVYRVLWDGVMSKFMIKEKPNNDISLVQDSFK